MLIAARNAMMAAGKLSAKSYIQDGLVAMWDGIENAGWGTHDGNATTWKDLVGTIDLTKGSGSYIWHDDCVEFTRVPGAWGYYYNRAPNLSVGFIECVFQMLGTPSSDVNGCFSIDGAHSARKMAQIGVIGGVVTVGISDGYHWDISNKYNDIYTTSFKIGWSPAPWYINAKEITEATGQQYRNGSNTYVHIGSFWQGCNGRIFSVRCYSRALSADEVAANYSIDKTRFNLDGGGGGRV